MNFLRKNRGFVASLGVALACIYIAHISRDAEPYVEYKGFYAMSAGASVSSLSYMPGTEAFFEDFILARKPCRIRLKTNTIPSELRWSTDMWSPEYLLDKVGADTMVAVETGVKRSRDGSKASFGSPSTMGNYQMLSWSKFLELMRQTDNIYLNLQDRARDSEEEIQERALGIPLSLLTDDFSVPPLALSMPLQKINMWIGNASACKNGTQSRLHFDDYDNFYVVLRGKKHFRLYAPNDTPLLYPYGNVVVIHKNGQISLRDPVGEFAKRQLPHFSEIEDSSRVNLESYPLFSEAKVFTVEVNAGELIYIPAGWWHEVTSFDFHVALNFWTIPPDNLVSQHFSDERRSHPTSGQYINMLLFRVESVLESFLNYIF